MGVKDRVPKKTCRGMKSGPMRGTKDNIFESPFRIEALSDDQGKEREEGPDDGDKGQGAEDDLQKPENRPDDGDEG